LYQSKKMSITVNSQIITRTTLFSLTIWILPMLLQGCGDFSDVKTSGKFGRGRDKLLDNAVNRVDPLADNNPKLLNQTAPEPAPAPALAPAPAPAPALAPAPLEFKQTDFVIGTYVNPYMTTYSMNHADFLEGNDIEDRRRYSDVKAAGFNVLMRSPRERLPATQIKRELRFASELELKYLVNDDRIVVPGAFSPFIASQVISDYQSLPTSLADSVYGYSLMDEPFVVLPEIKSWISLIKKTAPTKLGYFNLLPSYGFTSKSNFESYLGGYISSTLPSEEIPDVVSYDHYPLGKTWVTGSYFYDLRTLSARAKAIKKPFWGYPISVAWEAGYRPVDEKYLRFTTFAPIAYGVKGLIYYTYGTYRICKDPNNTSNCVGSFGEGMIGADNVTKTSSYFLAQVNNAYIRDVVGPFVMASTHLGVYHNSDYIYEGYGVSESIPSEERINASTPVLAGFSDPASNSMVAVFKHNSDPKIYYLFVVNRNFQGDALDVTLSLKGELAGRVFESSIASPTMNVMKSTLKNGQTEVIVKGIAAGEGRTIKLVSP
jgi:hypothetical protein